MIKEFKACLFNLANYYRDVMIILFSMSKDVLKFRLTGLNLMANIRLFSNNKNKC